MNRLGLQLMNTWSNWILHLRYRFLSAIFNMRCSVFHWIFLNSDVHICFILSDNTNAYLSDTFTHKYVRFMCQFWFWLCHLLFLIVLFEMHLVLILCLCLYSFIYCCHNVWCFLTLVHSDKIASAFLPTRASSFALHFHLYYVPLFSFHLLVIFN